METIAKRARFLLYYGIVLSGLGGIIIVLTLVLWCMSGSLDGRNFFGMIMGVIVIVWGSIYLVLYRRMPPVIIEYQEGVFYFCDGTSCRAEEVENVTFQQSHFKRSNRWFTMGSLTFYLPGRTVKFRRIDNVGEAYQRIMAIIVQSKDKN